MKLRQLEMALQRCAGFEKPRAAWEQYQTRPPLPPGSSMTRT